MNIQILTKHNKIFVNDFELDSLIASLNISQESENYFKFLFSELNNYFIFNTDFIKRCKELEINQINPIDTLKILKYLFSISVGEAKILYDDVL